MQPEISRSAKQRANSLVAKALKEGEIKKLPCEICGAIKVVAHHDDYNKPLDILWLCHTHHILRHVRGPKVFREWRVTSSHKGKVYLAGSLEKETYDGFIKLARKHSLTKSQALEFACRTCVEVHNQKNDDL